MARLDDAGMNRADGNLHHPFAVDAGDRPIGVLDARQPPGRIEVLAQRVLAARPVRVQHQPARIGMADRIQPEHVLDLPLVPVGRRDDGRDGGVGGVRAI